MDIRAYNYPDWIRSAWPVAAVNRDPCLLPPVLVMTLFRSKPCPTD